MKTLTIKKIDVVSFANFVAVLYATVMLVSTVISWVSSLMNFTELNTYFPHAVSWNWGSGIVAVIVYPLVAAVVGWVFGAVVSWFYNIALGNTAGIKFEVEE